MEKEYEHLGFATAQTLADNSYDDFSNTFSRDEISSDFKLARICVPPGCDVCHGNRELEAHFTTTRVEADGLAEVAEMPDVCQIYYIGRRHTFARLGISRQMFDELYCIYEIFSLIWDYVLAFGFKSKVAEVAQAAFKFRQKEPKFLKDGALGSFECAYGFSYTKLNGRRNFMNEDPDFNPWSIRQVAVYQQYDSVYKRLMFLLVAPSEEIRRDLEQEIVCQRRRNKTLNAFALHFVILSTLHHNWVSYLRDLGNVLKIQSDNVMLARASRDSDSISKSSELPTSFLDRQRLQLLEGRIIDLEVVFESILDTLTRLKLQCNKHHSRGIGSCSLDCSCAATSENIEELEHDVQQNLKRADTLHKKIQGTTQLLTSLLDFENAQIAHNNGKSLTKLLGEAKDENAKMIVLAERSTRDAAAVRILTVITLIYLPVTVVASLFSSQLVQVNEKGKVSVVADAWWFAAVSIPLTSATFLIWKLWLSHALKMGEKKIRAASKAEAEEPIEDEILSPWEGGGSHRPATIASRFMLALRKGGKRENLESGNGA